MSAKRWFLVVLALLACGSMAQVLRPTLGASSAPSCSGDVNGDGIVNLFDLVAISMRYGTGLYGVPEDLNGDGRVDLLDLVLVSTGYGCGSTVGPVIIPPPVVPTPTTAPGTQSGYVTQVLDGDTIEVEINGLRYRVRYIGMDTPEESGECYATEATNQNTAWVLHRTVRLEKDVSETDRYGRLLRYVYADGLFVNAELVRQGFAMVDTWPPDVRYADYFLQLQQEARNALRGLWAACVAPPRPLPTLTPPLQGSVIIHYVNYDGAVPRVESDEYAEISNQGASAVNLRGWRLNAGDRGQDFSFPDFLFQPGQACRVYTNQIHAESCGFSFRSGRAIWNNDGDCGYLYDAGGRLVSEYCY